MGKVVIIGAGTIGTSCAFSMINQGVCNEICLIDINEERTRGEVMDLSHCMGFSNSRSKVRLGTYKDCRDADIIVMTAAAKTPAGTKSRLEFFSSAVKITQNVVSQVMENGFNGIFLVAANPVDIVTYLIWKKSGLPRQQIIGTGTSLDSARLKTILARYLNVAPVSIHGLCMGEHGDSQVIVWSHVTVGGKPLLQLLVENDKLRKQVDLEKIYHEVVSAGPTIFSLKGSTSFGIGIALAYLVRSIFNDDEQVIPLSVILAGEYGLYDLAVGVPAVIGRQGIEQIIELNLEEQEKQHFDDSCKVVKNYIKMLDTL
ncbi:L-lactate dehydrogenase [Sporomusaceae bacterium BoRhaA]|uniref:L-lactate dehydrogenase n=1 Tax=Pelorhabdus rhamnosifermentans TaxID=2772457 RepID=UPI001C06380D|nr:L-lactate dehydrogenase [Pelorhabdus rhamnosifermentans]MBU2700477.1 L-lactate dehydrogenase [Pelorhabdus rhamnosifermentans]